MNKKLQNEYIEKMKRCSDKGDPEDFHGRADFLLCELLKKLGYKELIDEYNKVER